MRWWKSCVTWHPVNPTGVTPTHTEVSGRQKSNWRWQPLQVAGTLAGPSAGPCCEASARERSRHGCDWTVSKKSVIPLLAGGRFGWPRLPSLAGRWPRAVSEAVGKCDLLLHSVLHGRVSRACFLSGMELVQSDGTAAAPQENWLTSLGSTQVTDDEEVPPAHLISLLDPSWNMLPSQNSPLAVMAIQRIENTSARLRAKGTGSSLTLTPTPSNYCHQRYVTLQGTHMEKPRSPAENKGETPKHSTYQILQLHWKWYLTHFQSRTVYTKLDMIIGQQAHLLKLFFLPQNLIQWHSLLLFLWIIFHFFSLLLYHLNGNVSYILCLLCAKLLQSCPALCNPVDWSPPGSSVHRILQARILEWVVIPITRGSSQPREQTHVSSISCFGR